MEARSFLVVFPNYYGKGATLEEAVKNARSAGYRERRKVLADVMALSCEPAAVQVSAGVMVQAAFPQDAVCLRWQMKL